MGGRERDEALVRAGWNDPHVMKTIAQHIAEVDKVHPAPTEVSSERAERDVALEAAFEAACDGWADQQAMPDAASIIAARAAFRAALALPAAPAIDRSVLDRLAREAASEGAQAVCAANCDKWPSTKCEDCDGSGWTPGSDCEIECDSCDGLGYELNSASAMTDSLPFDEMIDRIVGEGVTAVSLPTAPVEASRDERAVTDSDHVAQREAIIAILWPDGQAPEHPPIVGRLRDLLAPHLDSRALAIEECARVCDQMRDKYPSGDYHTAATILGLRIRSLTAPHQPRGAVSEQHVCTALRYLDEGAPPLLARDALREALGLPFEQHEPGPMYAREMRCADHRRALVRIGWTECEPGENLTDERADALAVRAIGAIPSTPPRGPVAETGEASEKAKNEAIKSAAWRHYRATGEDYDARERIEAREALYAALNLPTILRATPPPESVPSEAETGSCGICGCDVTTDDEDCDDDGELVEGRVYMLPVTNGVYSTPTRTLLCEPCAFDMADRNSEAAEESDS
jgi:hypothetical protein